MNRKWQYLSKWHKIISNEENGNKLKSNRGNGNGENGKRSNMVRYWTYLIDATKQSKRIKFEMRV